MPEERKKRRGDETPSKSKPFSTAKDLYDWNLTFDAIDDPICVLGPDLKFRRCNKAMTRLVGKPLKEFIGRRCHELVHGTKRPIKGCPIQRMKKTHNRERMLLSLKERWFDVTVDPIIDNGRIIGAVHIIHDITEGKKAEEALLKERDFAEGLIKTAQVIVLVLDTKGRIVSINPYMEKLSGYKLTDVQGKNWFTTFLPMRDREHIREIFAKAIRGIQTQGNVNPIVTKDGRELEIEWYDTILKEPQGRVFGVLSIGQDITERKGVEDALRKSEERFRILFQTTQEGLVTADPDGKILSVNPATAKMLGYKSPKELVGRYTKEFYADQTQRMAVLKQLAQKGYVHDFEVNAKRKDNSEVYTLLSITIQKDKNGNILRTDGTFRDITERKKAEEKHRTIIKTALDGFCITDLQGRLLEANESYCRLTGYTREELLTMSVHNIEAIEDPDEVLQHIKRMSEQGSDHFETRHRRKDGKIIDVEVSVNYLDAEQRQMFAFLRDITERKKAEEAARNYQSQLKSLSSLLIKTEDRVRQRIAEGLHDDVGQKLAMAKLNLQLLMKSISDSNMLASLNKTCEEIEQITEAIHSLTFDIGSPILKNLGLRVAVEHLAEEIQHKHGIEFELEIGKQLGSLSEDVENCSFRIIRELLTNVVKHAQAKRVKISISRSTTHLHVSVKDEGVGFDAAKGMSISPGGGFGLFSAREQLEMLGGHLEVKSERGSGSRITLIIPL